MTSSVIIVCVDELAGFEEAWKDNVGKRLPSLSGSVNMHDYMGKPY